ncbi:MAG: four helix bundle protein [Gemmatimonadetes bacterium]|nr:four helix bundle protein [Gemmatimonadota bacterium]
MRFDHERLDAYRAAVTFLAWAPSALEGLPARRNFLGDQLMRAATSIPLNIAEGAGEHSRAEKARFYRIARRSAAECAAILDALRVLGFAESEQLSTGRELLERIVSMLVVLCQKLERPGTGTGTGTE